MKQLLARTLSGFDARDAIGAAGVCLLAYGLYQVYPPLAFIAAGGILTYVAIFGDR